MTEDQAIEAMAREFWLDDCRQAEIDCRLDRRPVPDKWADPWSPSGCGKRQAEIYEGRAVRALAAIRPYLDAQFAAGAEAMRKIILRAAHGEEVEYTGEPEDDAYNAAICHVSNAIRALPIPAPDWQTAFSNCKTKGPMW